MDQLTTNRNPIARNMWKANKPTIVPPKKGRKTPYKRIKKGFYID